MASIEDGNVQDHEEIDPQDEEGIIEEALELYREADDAWNEVRNEGLEDLRFSRLSDQWPLDIKQSRMLEKRPCLTVNMMPTFIRQVVNETRQNTPSVKVRPSGNGADAETADIFLGIIRNIESTSDADFAYDTAGESAVQSGFGFFRIGLDYAHDDSFDMDIKFHAIKNPFAVLWDANTEAADSSDWDYCFVVDTMRRKDFQRMYPGVDLTNFGNDDKLTGWVTEDEVRRAEYYRRTEVERAILLMSDGSVFDRDEYEANEQLQAICQATGNQVTQERTVKSHKITHRLITATNVLETTEWSGSIIPVIPVYGDEFNIEGRRYFRSLIHDAKDSQRLLNFWRTSTAEQISLAPKVPWIGPEQAFMGEDSEKWENANSKNYAYLSYSGAIAPTRPNPVELPAGALNEASLAMEDMKQIIGIHNPSLGMPDTRVISGKAKRMERSESDTSTYHFPDNLKRSIRCAGRVIVELIPKVYNSARIIRTLGTDGKPKEVAIGPQGSMPPQGFAKVFDLTVGKYDIAVDTGPSYSTRREETADTMTAVIQAFPQAFPLLADKMAKVQDWPDAEQIAERFATLLPPAIQAKEAGQPPPPPQPPPEVQAEMAKAQANIQIKQQEAAFNTQQKREEAQQRQQLELTQAQADIAVGQQKAQSDFELKRQEAALKFQLMREEHALQMELKTKEAEMNARIRAAQAAKEMSEPKEAAE